MKRFLTIFTLVTSLVFLIFSFTACTRNIPKKEKLNLDDYTITFEDNFEGSVLDETKWKIDTMINTEKPHLNGIRRAGYYVKDAVSVKDGNLLISTNYRKDGALGEGWYTGWVETSKDSKKRQHLTTNADYKGFNQTYGYFETRCICPGINGIWSAFWLMPDNDIAFSKDDVQGTASDGCEIDVMESPLYSQNRRVNQHVTHVDGYDSRLRSDKSPHFRVPNMYTEFHTYGVEWTPDKLIFYIDGYKTYETNVQVKKHVYGTPQVPEYLILSIEVGGSSNEKGELFPGIEKDGSKSWAGDPMFNNLDLTYDFVIDYVRVYQKN